MVSDRMHQEKKTKQTELDKLHMILDNPNNPQLGKICTQDDPTLESIRQRLAGKTPYSKAPFKPTQPTTSTPLQPRVSIHTAEPQEPISTQPIQRQATSATPRKTVQNVQCNPHDLYEIEKVDSITEDFIEVKPQEIQKPVEQKQEFILQQDEQSLDETNSFEAKESLPEWEPVHTIPSQHKTPSKEVEPAIAEFEPIHEESISKKTDGEVEFAEITAQEPGFEKIDTNIQQKQQRRLEKQKEKQEKKIAKQQAKIAKQLEKQQLIERQKHEKEQQQLEQEKTTTLPETQLTLEQTPVVKKFAFEIFKDISCIDEHCAELLYRHGYFSIENLRDATINDLIIIDGIDKRRAKAIKDEVDLIPAQPKEDVEPILVKKPVRQPKTKPAKEEFTEWESFESKKTIKPEIQKPITRGYIHDVYTLYKKEIETSGGKKTTIHFFSKEQPENGIPADLPEGYLVEINKKTGLPYLKKQKN